MIFIIRNVFLFKECFSSSAVHAQVSVILEQDVDQSAPVHVKVGEQVVLSCKTASEDIRLCEFIDPSGEHWMLATDINYEDGRLFYYGDNTKKACGIKITSTHQRDSGIWR